MSVEPKHFIVEYDGDIDGSYSTITYFWGQVEQAKSAAQEHFSYMNTNPKSLNWVVALPDKNGEVLLAFTDVGNYRIRR